ncbi:MAG TPA: class I tRNA ligase family protein, partial [Parachlamydiaceae bacterium]|nr:class I tRNA ligase family protein [Parachlamydiaceae bacterium]
EVNFLVDGFSETIKVYTTRPDTLFGATYMVLAPEHPLVEKITTKEQLEKVKEYQKQASGKSDLDRTELNKEKTGAFTGSFAVNPVNGKKIPIWISDYVLISYGTGSIMAVPAHDERDFEFATFFNLPIIPVYEPDDEAVKQEVLEGKKCWFGNGISINSQNEDVTLNGLGIEEAGKKMTEWLEMKGIGKATVNYKLRDWLFSRQRYWAEPFPILHFEDGTKRALELDELPLCPPELQDYKPTGDGKSPLARIKSWVEITDSKTGKKALRETNTMPQWAGSCWYYLRFLDPHNKMQAWDKEIEKYWMSVDLYVGGVEHAVLHLLYSRFWHKVLFDCGLVSQKEPFKTLRNQGIIVARSYLDVNNAYVAPDDVVEK